ncbi:MAG TPA: hypothetical protein VHE58_04490 [Burkholderiales bacterium]|nr:hypothetical protein [Burkholderiales bacterium]
MLLGCSPPTEKDTNQPQSLPVDVVSAKNDIKQLEELLAAITRRIVRLESEINQYKNATFDPTREHAFQRVDANVGTFLVVLENVQPYLDGQKITLLIGNLNYVIFNGLTLNVSWGSREPDWSKLNDEERTKAAEAYISTQHEKEVKLTDILRPATWNKVQFNIAPAKAEQFGELRISITTNQVQMGNAR